MKGYLLCSGIFVVFWDICCVLGYLLCSGIFVVLWNICCVLRYLLCSGIFIVFWDICCVLGYLLCSGIFVVFWDICYVLGYLLCSGILRCPFKSVFPVNSMKKLLQSPSECPLTRVSPQSVPSECPVKTGLLYFIHLNNNNVFKLIKI